MITVETEELNEIFTKYHLRGMPFDAVIHHIKEGDKGDFHDHPFDFTTHILKGWYVEEIASDRDARMYGQWFSTRTWNRNIDDTFHVKAETIHRITEVSREGCWTIIKPLQAARLKSGFWRPGPDNTVLYRPWDEPDFKPYKP